MVLDFLTGQYMISRTARLEAASHVPGSGSFESRKLIATFGRPTETTPSQWVYRAHGLWHTTCSLPLIEVISEGLCVDHLITHEYYFGIEPSGGFTVRGGAESSGLFVANPLKTGDLR